MSEAGFAFLTHSHDSISLHHAFYPFAFNQFMWWRGYSGRSKHFKIVLGSNSVAVLNFCKYACKIYLVRRREGKLCGYNLILE